MRRARVTAMAVIAAVGLTACGGGQEPDEGEAAPAPTVTVTVTETATPAEAEPLEESPTPTPAETTTSTPDPCDAPGLDGFAFIFVTTPTVGAPVSDGDTVEGCSNAFEATYQYELLDGDQAVLDSGFGTATCGTGCVGDFSFTLDFSVSQATVGYLRVYASSAQDGSDTLVNSIPVLLQP
ncbi:MAG: Gmad2 immunoglobulin-like domain-containing protein [Actinobacteria bacterium]|nr:Gmad2 immunoglobulin-like domain-containing protein [Actinomycetota bacterium]